MTDDLITQRGMALARLAEVAKDLPPGHELSFIHEYMHKIVESVVIPHEHDAEVVQLFVVPIPETDD